MREERRAAPPSIVPFLPSPSPLSLSLFACAELFLCLSPSRHTTQRFAELPEKPKSGAEKGQERMHSEDESFFIRPDLRRRAENVLPPSGGDNVPFLLSQPRPTRLFNFSLSLSTIQQQKNSRHHHRPGLPRRRHALRPAQCGRHRRAMRPDGERKFLFSFLSLFFAFASKNGPSSHSLSPSKQKKKLLLQWGSLDFHRNSLANLAEAMARTRKLCAIMLDTSGRVRGRRRKEKAAFLF